MSDILAFMTVVGVMVGLAALLLDGALHVAGRPSRLVWIAAPALLIGLSIWGAATQTPAQRATLPRTLTVPGVSAAAVATPAPRARIAEWKVVAQQWLDTSIAFVARRLPHGAGGTVAIVWGGATAWAVGLLLLVHLRARRARRRWPTAELFASPVRISDGAGPAVMGVAHPEIIVPHWMLARPEDEQRLAIEHEREHVRGGDPLVLAIGALTIALIPWHPAAWWMFARLRLAVEIDCDRRVLTQRRHASAQYGSMLIALAGRSHALPFGAPALAERRTHLERRLLAMTMRPAPFARTRATAGVAAALLLLLAACEAKVPTSAEVEQLDVARAEAAMKRTGAPSNDSTVYVVDGRKVSATEARLLPSKKIASVSVSKSKIGPNEVHVMTTDSLVPLAVDGRPGTLLPTKRVEPTLVPDSLAVRVEELIPSAGPSRVRDPNARPLVILDGKVVDGYTTLKQLDPAHIATIEVLKAPTATRFYEQPEAANGVILITLKKP